MLVNMRVTFCQFKKIRTCFTSCLTTNVIVAFCIHSISRKIHETAHRNAEQKFFMIEKLSCGLFFNAKHSTRFKSSIGEQIDLLCD